VENNVKKNKKSIVLRLFKDILEFYPVMLPVAIVCILFNATISSIPAVFMQNVIAIVENNWRTGDWNAVGGRILSLVTLSILSGIAYNQMMAIITQGTLKKFRCKMFARMQTLPIKYVDTHNHGDIMSVYTNDIDTLRQMISQSFPQLLWLTIIVLIGVIAMFFVTRRVGGIKSNKSILSRRGSQERF